MQFSTTLLFAAMAALASAQNPFTFTSLSSITAGTPFNITWAPSTGTASTVTLVLRQGESDDLDTVQTIASNIQNTGSYLWTPPTSLTNGAGYAFQIVNDLNTAIVNYSNQFSISSTNTVTSARSSTASPSSSPSASAPASTTSGPAATTATSSGAATGSSSSGTGSATSSGTRTSSSTSGSATGSATRKSSSTSGSATGSATAAPTSNMNGAGSLKVGGGLLAVLGAVMALL